MRAGHPAYRPAAKAANVIGTIHDAGSPTSTPAAAAATNQNVTSGGMASGYRRRSTRVAQASQNDPTEAHSGR